MTDGLMREPVNLVRQIKPVKITFCEKCDKAHLEGAWRTLEDPLIKTLSKGVLFHNDVEIQSVEFDLPEIEQKPGIQKEVQVLTVVTGEKDGETYEEEHEVPLSYLVSVCTSCKRKGTTYYEGILQIRNQTAQVVKEIDTYLSSHEEKGVHLAKEVPVDNGTDYYLSDHRAIGNLAKQLHKQFGGELKINAQHFSEDKQAGKILYRTTALVILPEYAKGDLIKKDDAYYLVLGISTKVKAENILANKQETFAYKKGEATKLVGKTTRVISTHPLAVLHPETFQPVELENEKHVPALQTDQEVEVVVDEEHVFFLRII